MPACKGKIISMLITFVQRLKQFTLMAGPEFEC